MWLKELLLKIESKLKMDKKYLIPAYIRRNAVLSWRLQNKRKTWKNSYWMCALANILFAGSFLSFGELLTQDLPRIIAACTAMCTYAIFAFFITFEIFDLKSDEE